MKNADYIDARNMLLPIAEKFANNKCGTSPRPNEFHEEWAAHWSLTFINKMNSLAKEQGLVK